MIPEYAMSAILITVTKLANNVELCKFFEKFTNYYFETPAGNVLITAVNETIATWLLLQCIPYM